MGQVTVLKYFSHYMEENLMDVSKYLYFPTLLSVIYLSCYYVSFVFPSPEALWHLSCCSLSNPALPFLLSQGGDLVSVADTHMPRLYLLQWLKSDRALMMLFNDGTFQVNTCTITGNTAVIRYA